MQKTTITAPLPCGFSETCAAQGVHIECRPDGVYSDNAAQAESIAAGYDPLSFVIAQQKAAATAMKWQVIEGGHTTAADIPLATDAASLSLITSLYAAAQASPGGTFSFKDRNGNFQSLTAAQVTTLYQDMSAWVQASYTAEHNLYTQISAPGQTWQQVAAIPIAGFPVNS